MEIMRLFFSSAASYEHYVEAYPNYSVSRFKRFSC